MNSLERTLQRLFKAAARAPKETPGSPSFALETRVLAGWRSGPVEDDFALMATLFQRAVLCAGAVMILSAGWTWFENRQQASGAMALANYTITIRLKP
jgi:hypothetical protein